MPRRGDVVLQPGESQESLLRRFRNYVARSGILRDAAMKKYFLTKRERRQLKRMRRRW